MSKAKGSELAKLDESWAITEASEGGSITQLMEDNLQGESISPFDLPKISVPSGGSSSWMVPAIGGEKAEKELVGVIVHTRLTRAWYEESFEEGGGGNPPDCLSEDGLSGRGAKAEAAEGGLCANCPLSEWGSARDGSGGQDCHAIRPFFLLRPDDLLPVRINAPAGSVANARRFLFGLATSRLRYWQVLAKLGLEKAQQKSGGLSYSRITFEATAKLEPSAVETIEKLREGLAPIFGRISAADIAREGKGVDAK